MENTPMEYNQMEYTPMKYAQIKYTPMEYTPMTSLGEVNQYKYWGYMKWKWRSVLVEINDIPGARDKL